MQTYNQIKKYLNWKSVERDLKDECKNTEYYYQYVLNEIEKEIEKNSIVAVGITNEDINYGIGTFSHIFTMVKEKEKIFRLESYINIYNKRMIEFNNWREELSNLMQSKNRIDVWNSIFSAKETKDTGYILDFCLYCWNKTD
jgi:hypothetical protein